jgi:hypothetical protein
VVTFIGREQQELTGWQHCARLRHGAGLKDMHRGERVCIFTLPLSFITNYVTHVGAQTSYTQYPRGDIFVFASAIGLTQGKTIHSTRGEAFLPLPQAIGLTQGKAKLVVTKNRTWLRPDSNRRPSVCLTDVIINYTMKPLARKIRTLVFNKLN